ncbi:phage baseplate assembly protein V [Sphingosinicella sp. BN140058]|uniref:phage baseplate assembly protein V n=1 Tax=Sphingosinicella sp. BN140058 TaxID=1892855 RepID=UPI0010119721|nr:phage baseplate assembly protein V [Sphingosinicella sp. BN140058]QAY79321.1 phage tail protein [Sphingosinicella sp. BN140058]
MNELLFDLEAHREAGGSVAGVATGTVTDNQDPEQLGRVKLKLPWRADDFESDWARVVTPMAGNGRGLYLLPEVGDEVLVAFDRNDIRYPYVLGALWSRTDAPPDGAATSENDIRMLRTRKGHVLKFDDAKAKGAITIELDDGKKIEIDDDGIRLSDGMSKVTMDAKAGSVTIEAAQSLNLKAPKITVEASATLELKGGGALSASAGIVRIN